MPYNSFPFELPPAPYPYDALEPYIDAETMFVHYNNLYGKYIQNLNSILMAYPRLQSLTLNEMLANPRSLPPDARIPVLRNAGGVSNHALFFGNLSPPSKEPRPPTELERMLDHNFGSLDNFKEAFSQKAMEVFGSGYVFLVQTRGGGLRIEIFANQDSPITLGFTPLLTLDVWEHAYFLKYKSNRAEYIKNVWNVLKII